MNTDEGLVVDYEDVWTPEKIASIRNFLTDFATEEDIKAFLKAVEYPAPAYRAHIKAHCTIPDSRDQQRYYDKLEKKLPDSQNR